MGAPLLPAEAEKRKKLHPRLADAQPSDKVEKLRPGFRTLEARLVLHDRHHRGQSSFSKPRQGGDNFSECPPTADRVVLLGGHSIEGDSDIQRVAAALESRGEPPHQLPVQENAIGDHRQRSNLQRHVHQRADGGMQKRLTPGEVGLAHSRVPSLVQRPLHLLHGHHRDLRRLWPAADEAMSARNVAEGPGDLDPEGVHPPERNDGAMSARAAFRTGWRPGACADKRAFHVGGARHGKHPTLPAAVLRTGSGHGQRQHHPRAAGASLLEGQRPAVGLDVLPTQGKA